MKNTENVVDLLVIGGGINGTAIARDAAGRGLSVMLCEKQDLAEGTSSKSSKLIHGGLRYLEYFEFRLVREALAEREVLMKTAPHVVWPQEFILPHTKELRPAWLIRLGLFLYDHIGGKRSLPPCHYVNLRNESVGEQIRQEYKIGFSYWDCRSDDARIVALNALDAHERGSEILTRTAYISARYDGTAWRVRLRNEWTGQDREVNARVIVNAAGPWANGVLTNLLGKSVKESVRNVKGSHIVLPRLYEGNHAYFLQNSDKRILFVIPYERDYTLVGNTDVAYGTEPAAVEISEEETKYMCDICSRYFKKPVNPVDVVWSWSGLRPLYDDGRENISAITRDYTLRIYRNPEGGPVLSIFGGKLTTGRQLAESAMRALSEFFPSMGPAWTHDKPLPGGDMSSESWPEFISRLQHQYPALPALLIEDYARRYGTRTWKLLKGVTKVEDLGLDFGGNLYEREVRYLMREEYALTEEDVLWRRTKLGLRVPKEGVARLAAWMKQEMSQPQFEDRARRKQYVF